MRILRLLSVLLSTVSPLNAARIIGVGTPVTGLSTPGAVLRIGPALGASPAASLSAPAVSLTGALPTVALPRTAVAAPIPAAQPVSARAEPIQQQFQQALKSKTPIGQIYDGGKSVRHTGDLADVPDFAASGAVPTIDEATALAIERDIDALTTEARDQDIQRRTNKLIKVLRGSYLNQKTKAQLREEIGALLDTYFAEKLPEPGYNRAAKLLKRASSDIYRRHIQKAITHIQMAQRDIQHKTSYRISVQVRSKRDGRSRAEVSHRYVAGGTSLGTLLKRLKKAGPFSFVRIGRGPWVPYDRLPLDLRLRADLVIDLVLTGR